MANINVGLGEIKIAQQSKDVLMAPGLGSCVGVLLYDPIDSIAAMAHVVLPESKDDNPILPGKYANTGIPALLKTILDKGAKKNNIKTYISGGAQMFSFDKGSNVLNIGTRNILAVKNALAKEGLKILNSHTGGNKGRTFKINMSDKKITVKCIGEDEITLGG